MPNCALESLDSAPHPTPLVRLCDFAYGAERMPGREWCAVLQRRSCRSGGKPIAQQKSSFSKFFEAKTEKLVVLPNDVSAKVRRVMRSFCDLIAGSGREPCERLLPRARETSLSADIDSMNRFSVAVV
jgi:hypothetical protein